MIRSLVAALLLCAGVARAQTLRGVVVDNVYGRPIAGAVVLTIDSAQMMIGRTATSEDGRFSISRGAATRLRVLRIGYRPTDITGPALDSVGLRIVVTAIPQMLEPVISRVSSRCPRRKDRDETYGFWEQAKAGLMASVVSRQSNPARVMTLVYKRPLHKDDTFTSQLVQVDSGEWSNTFGALLSAEDFAAYGFVNQSNDGRTVFSGPDAEVLLADNFQATYCFSLAKAQKDRPTQVGLRFEPAKRDPKRVDIDGTFWIDTAARQLRDIEFKYVGLGREAEREKPGGHVTFKELGNGLPFVDTWNIRMVESEIVPASPSAMRGGRVAVGRLGSRPPPSPRPMTTRQTYVSVTDAGGELAHAKWADGTEFHSKLGAARIRVMREDGTPVEHFAVALDSTEYHGVTDSLGYVEFKDLFPGPYAMVHVDSVLDEIGIKVRSTLNFMAERDSVSRGTFFIKDPGRVIATACGEQAYTGWASVVARVATPDNKPVAGARWKLGELSGRTGTNGVIMTCGKHIIGDKLQLDVWRDQGTVTGTNPVTTTVEVTDLVVAVKVALPQL